ncbi:MAG TPA: fumarylacetoacetate hydrolase family protein [bacterium]|nr:fumarylacetoacetate hydrolase family protein [bacterium]
MRIARYWIPGQGARLGVCEGGTVRELVPPDAPALVSFEDLVDLARRTPPRVSLGDFVRDLRGSAPSYSYRDLDRAPDPDVPHLLLPVIPPEVWAAGVTYERSREARLAETTTVGIYDKIYEAERPEVFFKATASRCVGPNASVGIRVDSRWTVPEPELGVVLGGGGEVLGYTLGNDMSARDIEGENPLYLPQTKIYRACCSIGPTILLTDVSAAARLTLWCRIERRGREAFRGEINTARIRRPIAELVTYLRRANDIPPMTVLLTGTGIVPPDEFACEEGDMIEIGAEEIGVLRNTAVRVS